MDFGSNMMLISKQKKLSQSALRKLTGTSGDVIGRNERGDISPSVDVVVKIADVLEVSLDFLIGVTDIELNKSIINKTLTIQKLSEEDKEHIMYSIDGFIRHSKNRETYIK